MWDLHPWNEYYYERELNMAKKKSGYAKDKALDKKKGIKENSKKDKALDKKKGFK